MAFDSNAFSASAFSSSAFQFIGLVVGWLRQFRFSYIRRIVRR